MQQPFDLGHSDSWGDAKDVVNVNPELSCPFPVCVVRPLPREHTVALLFRDLIPQLSDCSKGLTPPCQRVSDAQLFDSFHEQTPRALVMMGLWGDLS